MLSARWSLVLALVVKRDKTDFVLAVYREGLVERI